MASEQDIFNFKVAFLRHLAERGISPAQAGASLRQGSSTVKEAAEKVAAIPVLSDALNAVGTVAKYWAVPIALAGGGALGYLGEHVTGPRQEDVEEARALQRLRALQRATLRIDTLARATQEEATNARRKKPTLQIRSTPQV